MWSPPQVITKFPDGWVTCLSSTLVLTFKSLLQGYYNHQNPSSEVLQKWCNQSRKSFLISITVMFVAHVLSSAAGSRIRSSSTPPASVTSAWCFCWTWPCSSWWCCRSAAATANAATARCERRWVFCWNGSRLRYPLPAVSRSGRRFAFERRESSVSMSSFSHSRWTERDLGQCFYWNLKNSTETSFLI